MRDTGDFFDTRHRPGEQPGRGQYLTYQGVPMSIPRRLRFEILRREIKRRNAEALGVFDEMMMEQEPCPELRFGLEEETL